MRKPGQISIDDLYFGIVVEDFNDGENFLRTTNLFNSGRVKRSVAMWVTSDDEFKKEHDLIRWCFGDVWGRREYELAVAPLFEVEKAKKVDTYELFVKPNEKLLTKMVNSVSVASAKKYLSAERKSMKTYGKV